jgi:hypothetical protein
MKRKFRQLPTANALIAGAECPEASGKRTESNEKIVANGVEMGKFFAALIIQTLLFRARKAFGPSRAKFPKITASNESVMLSCGERSLQEMRSDTITLEEILSVTTS